MGTSSMANTPDLHRTITLNDHDEEGKKNTNMTQCSISIDNSFVCREVVSLILMACDAYPSDQFSKAISMETHFTLSIARA